jgi:hypothetical protein
VKRLLLAALCGVALMTTVTSGSTHANATTNCLTTTYIGLLNTADAALAAVPVQPVAALTALTQAEDLDPASVPVLAPIIGQLTAGPPDIVASRRQLDLLTATLSLPAGSACDVDSRDAEAALHGVYASHVFAGLDQNPPPSLFQRIGAAITWVLSHLYGLLGNGGSIGLGALVLAVIATFIIHRVRGVAGGRRAKQLQEPATAGDDPDDEWRMALAAAQRGDHREAVRRAFRSALLDVAGRRARIDRAWTTREMLATISADADLLAVVAPAAAAFDKAWYADVPVTQAEWDIARARCEAVRRVARRTSSAPRQ